MTDGRDESRALWRTPAPGRQPVRIPAWTYQAVADAVLAVVPREGNGLPFADLAGSVAARGDPALCTELGSVSWHTTLAEADPGARVLLARVPVTGPRRLLRSADKTSMGSGSAG